MTDNVHAVLLRTLLARYREFRERLTLRLDSPELAADAMQETWLRVRRLDRISKVRNPDAYLYRAALNTGLNLRQARSRRLLLVDIDALLGIVDEAPGPETIAADRGELKRLAAAVAELTDRQQAIFRASFLDDVPHRELASRFRVSVRTIQIDLKHAIAHCAQRLGRGPGFANDAAVLSKAEEPES